MADSRETTPIKPIDVDKVLAQLTLKEKTDLLSGEL